MKPHTLLPLLTLVGASASGCAFSSAGNGVEEPSVLEGPGAAGSGYAVEIRRLPAQPVMSRRGRVESAQVAAMITEFTWDVVEYLRDRGVEPAGRPFTRYHGESGGMIDLEVGFPVSEGHPGDELVRSGRLPGGLVAMTTHWGSYDGLLGAGAAISDYTRSIGAVESGEADWQVYLVAPGDDPEVSRWQTQIVRPLDSVPGSQ